MSEENEKRKSELYLVLSDIVADCEMCLDSGYFPCERCDNPKLRTEVYEELYRL